MVTILRLLDGEAATPVMRTGFMGEIRDVVEHMRATVISLVLFGLVALVLEMSEIVAAYAF